MNLISGNNLSISLVLIINISCVFLWKIEDDKFKCPQVREIKNFDINQVC